MNNELEKELINYSGENNDFLLKQIVDYKKKYISLKEEENANYYWLLEHIYIVKNNYVTSFNLMKNRDFEIAWKKLDDCDIVICELLDNADEQWLERFNIVFIKNQIGEYQKLFPYNLFLSRESIIKKEICSICGKEMGLRNRCNHKIGKLYMGDICFADVKEMELLSWSIVTNPHDKYCILKVEGEDFNYGILIKALSNIDSPYKKIMVTKEYIFKEGNDINNTTPHTIEWLRSIQEIKYSIEIDE